MAQLVKANRAENIPVLSERLVDHVSRRCSAIDFNDGKPFSITDISMIGEVIHH